MDVNGSAVHQDDVYLFCSNCDVEVTKIPGKEGFYCHLCDAFVDCYAPFVTQFETKDSGERIEYETGARRDVETGKGRYDLISPLMLRRLAQLMERGAHKYGDRNWENGIPVSRFHSSALRHLLQAVDPDADKSEDHLAAAIFNIQGMMFTAEEVKKGKLPASLLDMDI